MNNDEKMDKLWEQFDAECEEIARQCEEEGYPSHGNNYELRVDELMKSYPELFEHNEEEQDYGEETQLEVVEVREFDPSDPNRYEAPDIDEENTFNDTLKHLQNTMDVKSHDNREEEMER